jgi:hypothetical protein
VGVVIVHKERDFCHHVRVKKNRLESSEHVDFIGKLKHYKVV